MMTKDETMREQAAEIERLRAELEQTKRSGEAVYPLPHTLRKGQGDLWRGNVRGRERPDNVPADDRVTPTTGPTNQEVIEAMAARAIGEATKE